jgi:hypothetical protein
MTNGIEHEEDDNTDTSTTNQQTSSNTERCNVLQLRRDGVQTTVEAREQRRGLDNNQRQNNDKSANEAPEATSTSLGAWEFSTQH